MFCFLFNFHLCLLLFFFRSCFSFFSLFLCRDRLLFFYFSLLFSSSRYDGSYFLLLFFNVILFSVMICRFWCWSGRLWLLLSSSSSIGKLFMFIIDFKVAFRFYTFIMLEFSFSDFIGHNLMVMGIVLLLSAVLAILLSCFSKFNV